MAGSGMRALLLAAFIFIVLVTPLHAEDVDISSDSMETRGNIHILTGSVVIVRGETRITADTAAYDTESGDAYFEGRVHLEDPDITADAESAEVNLNKMTGTFRNGEMLVKKDNFRMRGKEIEKEGKDRYVLRNASATYCEGISPEWCLSGKEADVLIGERLRVSHAAFRIKGIPVFYTPYLWAPIVIERRSGFLPPTLGYRDSAGFYYRQPYYWAISENRDATIFADIYSKGDMGEGIEYRYVERPNIFGNINLFHIRNDSLNRDYLEARASHDHQGRNVSGYIDLNMVSHNDSYRRYEPYIETSSKRFLESASEVSALWGKTRFYILGRYFQDLMEGVDEDEIIQRLPEAGVYHAPEKLGPVVFSASASGVNFERKEGSDGMRFNISARGIHSIGREPNLTQTVTAEELIYRLSDESGGEDTLGNTIFDYKAAVRAGFSRDYGGVHHSVVPSLLYRYRERDGDSPPFLDSTELQGEASRVEMEVINRLMDKRGEFFTLKAVQPYNFKNDDRPFEPITVNMAIRMPFWLSMGASYDYYEEAVNSADAQATFKLTDTTITAGQSYSRASDIMLSSLEATHRATTRLDIEGRIRYDSIHGGWREVASVLNYKRQCWAINVSFVKKPEDYGVFVKVNLLGIGEL